MMIYNLLHSVRLLTDSCRSFRESVDGLKANEEVIQDHLENQ